MRTHVIHIILICFLLAACDTSQSKTEKMSSKDFSFKIIEMTSVFNSKTEKYTRKYVGKDSSVNVKLDEKELQQIQKLMTDLGFEHFPEKFECSENGTFTLPSFETTIEISINGKLKKVTNTSFCDTKVQQNMANSFEKIVIRIHRILDSKKEVKNMRPCDMIFF